MVNLIFLNVTSIKSFITLGLSILLISKLYHNFMMCFPVPCSISKDPAASVGMFTRG